MACALANPTDQQRAKYPDAVAYHQAPTLTGCQNGLRMLVEELDRRVRRRWVVTQAACPPR